MRRSIITFMLAASALPLGGCTLYGDAYGSSYASGFGPAPDAPFYADHHYRDDPRYRARTLRRDEAIYVGSDGRYYCRRDGTTGLIVGGVAGGTLDALIAPGEAKTLRVLLDAPTGAAIDAGHVRCR